MILKIRSVDNEHTLLKFNKIPSRFGYALRREMDKYISCLEWQRDKNSDSHSRTGDFHSLDGEWKSYDNGQKRIFASYWRTAEFVGTIERREELAQLFLRKAKKEIPADFQFPML